MFKAETLTSNVVSIDKPGKKKKQMKVQDENEKKALGQLNKLTGLKSYEQLIELCRQNGGSQELSEHEFLELLGRTAFIYRVSF